MENGNGKIWKIISLVAIPAYGLIGWCFWAVVTTAPSVVKHEDNIALIWAEIKQLRSDSATVKDIAAIQRDYIGLRAEISEKYQNSLINQNKIEAAIQAAQAEMRNKMDVATAAINSIKVQIGEGHLRR